MERQRDRIFGVQPVQGLLMVALYVFSTVIALIVAAVLGRTLIKGKSVPLLLEMPPYRVPHRPSVLAQMWRKTRVFLTEAGTVIFACTVVMWLLLTFSRQPELDAQYAAHIESVEAQLPAGEERDERIAALENERAGEALRSGYGGRPVYTPLVGLALVVFFAIACQCMSTLAVVKRETRSCTWPTFLFICTGALAWLLSFAVFQGGVLLGLG